MSRSACDLRRLVACEEHGLAWQQAPSPRPDREDVPPLLMAAAPRDGFKWPGKCAAGCAAGEWFAPCAEAHGATRCTEEPDTPLVIFTHMPKCGGTSLGQALVAAHQAQSQLSACHLRWNGHAAVHTCGAMRRWLRRRGVWHAPPLPFGTSSSAASANASLSHGAPSRHCGMLWAQHMDASLLSLARAAHPQRRVLAVLVVSSPARLFFREFRYKKHCLWRQQGLAAADAAYARRELPAGRSLAAQIAALRRSPTRRTMLLRFLAGSSWCSCSPRAAPHRRLLRRASSLATATAVTTAAAIAAAAAAAAANASLDDRLDGLRSTELNGAGEDTQSLERLRRRARRGVRQYAVIGVLERPAETEMLLRDVLGWPHLRLEHRNPSCVGKTPREDEPTAEQHTEVAMLLREEQLVYDEIVARFERQIAARNATSRTPRTREAGSMERDTTQ